MRKASRKTVDELRAEYKRSDFGPLVRGKYALIDIRTEKLFLAESPEDAYRRAAAEHEEGPFHPVRIGDRAAFRSRRVPNGADTRVTR